MLDTLRFPFLNIGGLLVVMTTLNVAIHGPFAKELQNSVRVLLVAITTNELKMPQCVADCSKRVVAKVLQLAPRGVSVLIRAIGLASSFLADRQITGKEQGTGTAQTHGGMARIVAR